jgi:hypothetical protein
MHAINVKFATSNPPYDTTINDNYHIGKIYGNHTICMKWLHAKESKDRHLLGIYKHINNKFANKGNEHDI